MFGQRTWYALLLFGLLLMAAVGVRAQTATPSPAATPSPTPAPTEPPAILVIQPTPPPTAPLTGNLGDKIRKIVEDNEAAILLAIVMALATGILVGVFFKSIAEQINKGLGWLLHKLFDGIAALPIIRWPYEKEYRKRLAAAVQELQGGAIIDRPLHLEEMYIPSLLTEETRPDIQGNFADWFRTRAELRRQQQERAVDGWEALRRFNRFVVLGGPGAGKTTYLSHLAFTCAQRRRPELKGYLPIFIRFRQLVPGLAKLENLEDSFPQILKEYQFPNAQSYLARRLKQGRCLVLLDGLDEVADQAQHERLIELARRFATQYLHPENLPHAGNILVISSRTYSYDHGSQLVGFAKTEVMEFDPVGIEVFVHKWFRDKKTADELWAKLKKNSRFMELASSPLLLLLIAHQYETSRNLPRLRAELYERCVRTRIIEWNTKRGTHNGRFGERDKINLLGELALHLYEQESEGLLSKRKLLDWLDKFVQDNPLEEDATAEQLLDEIVRTSGLLYEWAIDRYGFSHQTLQEYFAADAIAQLGPEEGAARLAAHAAAPAWKEIVLLYSALIKDVKPLLQGLVARARQPDTGKTIWLLAGDCLAERARPVHGALSQELVQALVALLHHPQAPQLTQDERNRTVTNLKQFAADQLPRYARRLAASERASDWLLAERLLPDNAPADLRTAVQGRMVALAGDADLATQQAALAALGRLGGADAGAVAALRLALSDADAAARAEAARALARQGAGAVTPDVVDALRHMHDGDAADAPRQAALAALLALGQAEAVGMVHVPAGEFLMGSGDDDRAADKDEKPQQRLYLPAYYLDRAPVTNAQFRRFLEAGGYANPAYWAEAQAAGRWQDGQYIYDDKTWDRPRYWDDAKWNGAAQPVVGVSWYEALAYARWAGKRLPTEAEWEKGARGTDGRLYPWDGAWTAARANTKEAKQERTTPVGQYSPAGDSPYGAVDMAGNVWEWCGTRWRDEGGKEYTYPYNPNDGREELGGGDDVGRVLRGGSWASEQKRARCAARAGTIPGDRFDSRGFRCCATSSLVPGAEF